jgi:hypothetical protein
MLVLIGFPVITKRMAPHRHPPPCRSNIGQSMKSTVDGVKSAMRRGGGQALSCRALGKRARRSAGTLEQAVSSNREPGAAAAVRYDMAHELSRRRPAYWGERAVGFRDARALRRERR